MPMIKMTVKEIRELADKLSNFDDNHIIFLKNVGDKTPLACMVYKEGNPPEYLANIKIHDKI